MEQCLSAAAAAVVVLKLIEFGISFCSSMHLYIFVVDRQLWVLVCRLERDS